MDKIKIVLGLLAFAGLSVGATAQTWDCGAQGNKPLAQICNLCAV